MWSLHTRASYVLLVHGSFSKVLQSSVHARHTYRPVSSFSIAMSNYLYCFQIRQCYTYDTALCFVDLKAFLPSGFFYIARKFGGFVSAKRMSNSRLSIFLLEEDIQSLIASGERASTVPISGETESANQSGCGSCCSAGYSFDTGSNTTTIFPATLIS